MLEQVFRGHRLVHKDETHHDVTDGSRATAEVDNPDVLGSLIVQRQVVVVKCDNDVAAIATDSQVLHIRRAAQSSISRGDCLDSSLLKSRRDRTVEMLIQQKPQLTQRSDAAVVPPTSTDTSDGTPLRSALRA